MGLQNWVDLSSYGAQFKRLNLPNGTSVPIVVVEDVEKFNQTATHLSNFKQGVDNDIPFEALPGNKKGREFNQPILFMTKSFKDVGNTPYAVMPSLAKLLNITLEEVKSLKKEMPEDQIVSDIPYADVEKFAAITNICYQAYSGNTLYAVKNPTNYENLVEYAEAISETQHGLFPKSNVANIPFETLDKFGLSTSIVGRGFLNPQDAKKNGYDISELTRIHLDGEMSILPISINRDLSINFISNVSEVSQLAYSNFKWKDNINLIRDYNALAAVHEASRNILNTRPSAIQSPDQFNNLIENISVTLQNFNESSGVANSHKPIKYFNKGVTSHVIKNEQGEWRYIEKDAIKKLDEPLTWSNYQKALSTIANYNSILSAALEMEVKQGAEFNNALQKVFSNHNQFYMTNTQVVENLADAKPNGRLVIHTNGKKIHKQKVNESVNSFQRDMGETLYAEGVKQLLAGMRSVEDAGNIKNTVGQYVDDYALNNTIQELGEDPVIDDIGLSMLDQISQGERLDFVREAFKEQISVTPIVDVSAYTTLPKGINDAIDSNHAVVNDIYKTLQHIELSQIPYYENIRHSSKQEIDKLSAHLDSKVTASFEDYLKHGDTVFAENNEQKNLDLHTQIEVLSDSVEQYDQIIDHSRIQANILRYQFSKHLVGLDQPIHGALVLQSDDQGNYKPFDDATSYRTAVKLVQNSFAANNADGYIPRNSVLSTNLDAFVAQHYAITAIDSLEPVNALANVSQTLGSTQSFSLPSIEAVESLPIPKVDEVELHSEILRTATQAMRNYSEATEVSVTLNKALAYVARHAQHIKLNTGIDFNLTNNHEYNALLKSFSDAAGDLSYPTKMQFKSPINGVVIGDMTKVALLKAVADKSISYLDAEDVLVSTLLNDYGVSAAGAQAFAREQVELRTEQELMQKMAGQFLVNYQSSLKSGEKPQGVYHYTLNGSADDFKVKNAEYKNIPQDAITLNQSNTLNAAVREAFVAYQVHQVASDLGITSGNLAQIQEIAQHLKAGDHEKVAELSSAAFGQKLTAKDLTSLSFIAPTKDLDNLGNRLMLIEAEDVGQIHLPHESTQMLLDRVGMCLKLAGEPTDLRLNPLLKGLGSTSEFEKVQKYLMPELEEHGKILALIKEAEDQTPLVQPLSDMMADYATIAYKSALAQNIQINPKEASVITNTANSENDVVFSRVVPANWYVPFAKQSIGDFNQTPLWNNSDEMPKSLLSGHIADQIQFGNIMMRPSAPVIPLVNEKSKPDFTLLDMENHVLNEGGAVIGASILHVELFKQNYAVANFGAAINCLPDSMVTKISKAINENSGLNDAFIRVSMTEQKGSSLPQLKFNDFSASFGKDEKFMCALSPSDIARHLKDGDFNLSQFGKTPVVLVPNDSAYTMNNMFLERIGFDLQDYLNSVKGTLGFDDLTIEKPSAKIDNLAPITFNESSLSKGLINSNTTLFKNILLADLAQTTPAGIVDVDKLIHSAKVFIKAEGSDVTMALADSEAKCRGYIDAGFTAVRETYTPHHGPAESFNILRKLGGKVITADDLEQMNVHVDQFFKVVDEYQLEADPLDQVLTIDSISKFDFDFNGSEFISAPEVRDQIIEATAKELAAFNSSIPVKAETQFVEKLSAYSFDEVSKMRSVELAEKITLDKVWPQVSIEDHLRSGHQNLDTLLLARTLRDGIEVKQIELNEGSSIEKNALAYNFFLSEMHGAVSKSRTPEDLLVKFDKAYTNVTNMDPEFFSRVPGKNDHNKQCEVFNALKKASHAHLNGMSARESLKLGVESNLEFKSKYDDVALSVGQAEKLYSGEKPFVYYMNGFTLNAEGAALNSLNNIILSRMDDVRQSSLIDLAGHESQSVVVHRDIVNVLDAKSPVDYNLDESAQELQSKWGIDFSVAPQDKHLAQGYVAIANGVLQQLHDNLQSQATMDQVGRGLSIQGGFPLGADNAKDIHLIDIAGGTAGSYEHFANRYINQLVRKIEAEEVKLMSTVEISQFSAIKEDFQGLVSMSQKYGYEPKTEAGKSLLAVHESLVIGISANQPVNSAKAVLEHSSLVVSDKLQEVERNVEKYKTDHTGAYAKHYISYMESRQDAAVRTLADKMRKMQSSNPDAPDMYHFVPAVDMLDKISNTATITSKSAVDKFAEDFHKKNSENSKDSITLMLQAALAEKPESILQAQDYLASRAADKFIQLLDEYAPESIKGTEKFVDNLDKFFGSKLGENIQVAQMQYASEFGYSQELAHKNAVITDPDHTPTELNADKVVYNYLNASLAKDDGVLMVTSEKENALKLFAEVLVAHDKDRKLNQVVEVHQELDKRKESGISYEQ